MFCMKRRSILTCTVSSLLLAGCGGGSDSSSDVPASIVSPNVNGTPSLASVSTYQTSSMSKDIEECSKAFLVNSSCDLSVIKPLGVNQVNVTIEQIQERLVVSHQWMADSFIEALKEINDQDLLNLFKPLNSIVISYDIRPSFYTTSTASMYIDPKYVWRNKSEWDSIHKQEDYRNGFQTEFKFDKAQRYVHEATNDYISYSNTYTPLRNESREANHIAPGLFRLLSHELAHANDFLQEHDLTQIPSYGYITNYIHPLKKLNHELIERDPLTSNLLKKAAQIAFQGESMTNEIRRLTGEVAGDAFEADKAAAFYSYSSPAEDVAMLFEAYMMYKKYRALSDVAFLSIPQIEDYSCNDWKVQWGQRSRLSDNDVQDRAVFVASGILGKSELTIRAELSSLPAAPEVLSVGQGWCSSQKFMDVNPEARSVISAASMTGFSENTRYLEDLEN
ncbi:hypothetical protein AB6D20_004370 [Vibrio splendidus]|uniref:hypothetical protein n=1 Tax=Vibrio splendidus TaxID=29497 RepID=UPI000C82EB02|nr:hypothetical protein [Vibrio splendidus]MDH5889561.1 hypothetical protein [Vibrio splendidus]PMJ45682.1 hypothetical protein BCU23_04920 [Vibrio splendidus]PMN21204.1 hypothetical protein BCT36_17995 [Vibrio splendidus]HAH03659.1 hypothetical protein [Vibrio sp.]